MISDPVNNIGVNALSFLCDLLQDLGWGLDAVLNSSDYMFFMTCLNALQLSVILSM